jgi:hypothetical protein
LLGHRYDKGKGRLVPHKYGFSSTVIKSNEEFQINGSLPKMNFSKKSHADLNQKVSRLWQLKKRVKDLGKFLSKRVN